MVGESTIWNWSRAASHEAGRTRPTSPCICAGIRRGQRRRLALQALDRVGLGHKVTARPAACRGASGSGSPSRGRWRATSPVASTSSTGNLGLGHRRCDPGPAGRTQRRRGPSLSSPMTTTRYPGPAAHRDARRPQAIRWNQGAAKTGYVLLSTSPRCARRSPGWRHACWHIRPVPTFQSTDHLTRIVRLSARCPQHRQARSDPHRESPLPSMRESTGTRPCLAANPSARRRGQRRAFAARESRKSGDPCTGDRSNGTPPGTAELGKAQAASRVRRRGRRALSRVKAG